MSSNCWKFSFSLCVRFLHRSLNSGEFSRQRFSKFRFVVDYFLLFCPNRAGSVQIYIGHWRSTFNIFAASLTESKVLSLYAFAVAVVPSYVWLNFGCTSSHSAAATNLKIWCKIGTRQLCPHQPFVCTNCISGR